MSQVIKAFKSHAIVFLLLSISFSFFLHFPDYWRDFTSVSEKIVYLFAAICIVFSAQFSRSRLSWLSLFFIAIFSLLYFQAFAFSQELIRFLNQFDLEITTTLDGTNAQSQWLMLVGIFWLGFLSLSKDRGLLSIHSAYRILALVALCVLAKLWLQLSLFITHQIHNESLLPYLPWLKVEVPLTILFMILVFKSFKVADLMSTAIIASAVIWTLYYYQPLALPWSISLSILMVFYIFVVIIDSYFLAYRDELTSLPSRRALNQLALSLGRNYSVAMMDIDHFKKFNDKYGHDIGDQVLKLVASKLNKVKGGGRVFRYGGEEFTVVFPRKSIEQSTNELEDLRQSIADYKMVIRQPVRKSKEARSNKAQTQAKSVSVTISIGVAMREKKQTFEQALKAADQALYRAKNNGRNNVSI